MRKVMSYVGFGAAIVTGFLAMSHTVNAQSAVVPTPAVTVSTNTLPACQYDEFDSAIANCYYDATTRGHGTKGTGKSFIIYNGHLYTFTK